MPTMPLLSLRNWLQILVASILLAGLSTLWSVLWESPQWLRQQQSLQHTRASQIEALYKLQMLLTGLSHETEHAPSEPMRTDSWRQAWLYAQTLSKEITSAPALPGLSKEALADFQQAFNPWHQAMGAALYPSGSGSTAAAPVAKLHQAQRQWAPPLLSQTQSLTHTLGQWEAGSHGQQWGWVDALQGGALLVALFAIAGVGMTLRRLVGTEPARLERITREIVQGNYQPELPDQHNRPGQVITNIAAMLEHLRANQRVTQHRLWLDKGLALINDTVRNEYAIHDLSKRICENLSIFLELQACALYLYAFGAEDDSMIQRKALRLHGLYCRDGNPFPERLRHGLRELQHALPQNRLLHTRDMSAPLLSELRTQAHDTAAHYVMVPLQFENEIRGTLILKSRLQLPPHLSDLMGPGSVAIGVALESALNRETLMASLMDAQRLTNQLQVNHEKLQYSQSALQDKIHYVNNILSSMHSGLLIVDQQGKIVDCNPALQKMTGLAREQLLGMHSDHLFEEDDTSLSSILKSYGQMLTHLGLQNPEGYRELITGSMLGCLLLDTEGRVLLTNARASQITGYPLADLETLSVNDLIPPRYRRKHSELLPLAQLDGNLHRAGSGRQLPLLRKDHQEVLVEISLVNHQFEGQTATLAWLRTEHDLPWAVINSNTVRRLVQVDEDTMVTRLRHADGHHTPVRISSSFMLDATGIPQQTVINVHDVSTLIHKSQEIRAQHQLLEMSMDAMQDGVLRIDREGHLISANPMVLELLGLDKDRVLNSHIADLLPGQQNGHDMGYWMPFAFEHLMARLIHQVGHACEEAQSLPVPLLALNQLGQLQWATPTACELLGLNPAPQHSKIAVPLAPETAEQLQTLRENMPAQPHTPCIVDVAWRAGNAPTMRLPTLIIRGPGIPQDQMLVWLIPELDALCAYAIQRLHNQEWRILHPEGLLIPVLLTASPLLDPYGRLTGAVLTIKDMREIKEKEAENLRMVQKMEQSQKLDALGQLAAGVAHDFNNLLGVIQNHAELVEMKIGTDSKAAKNLSAILQATTRARDIVIKLNGLGRDPKAESAEDNHLFELEPLIQETQSLLQASLKGIDILVQAPAATDKILLKGQSGSLQQVVVNLCVNASHAIGDRRDGRILIEVGPPSEGQVNIDVVDNGSGIPPEILPRIFEPFFTTKEVGKGTGLGLAMVRSIVTKMGGSIDCTSEVGVGTRFSLRLPCERQG